MNLSKNFTLLEATKSSTAQRLGIDNTPSDEQIEALAHVAKGILQPVRDHYKIPFSPNSWFRCLELNRVIKSKDTSQHILGEAVDFEVPGVSNFDLATWCRENLHFDQLIIEFYDSNDPTAGWVHCSSKRNGSDRYEVLTIGKGGTLYGLPEAV